MKKMRFEVDDLEDRATLLLMEGEFIALKIRIFETCALYELYGHYVEVVVSKSHRKRFNKVLSIEFLDDTNVIASYVTRRFFRQFVHELFKPQNL